MGKKAKEHRAKVAKRNRVISQNRYSMQNKLNKMMEKMAEQQAQELEVKVGDENVPFEVVGQPSSVGIKGFEFEGNVLFKEENPEILNIEEFEPELDSAGFSVEDREEPKQENEQ